jgi:hypothetical protein
MIISESSLCRMLWNSRLRWRELKLNFKVKYYFIKFDKVLIILFHFCLELTRIYNREKTNVVKSCPILNYCKKVVDMFFKGPEQSK